MRIYDQKKTSAKIVQKSDLGGSWAPFGKGLGGSGPSWGHFGAHFDCLPWFSPLFEWNRNVTEVTNGYVEWHLALAVALALALAFAFVLCVSPRSLGKPQER